MTTIYQLKAKIDEWKTYKKNRDTFYDRDYLVLRGLDDIADNEEFYCTLLRTAEQEANRVIKEALKTK